MGTDWPRARAGAGSQGAGIRGVGVAPPRRDRRAARPSGRSRQLEATTGRRSTWPPTSACVPSMAHCHLGLGKLYRRTGDRREGARAPDDRERHVPGDGHGVLAGEGRDGAGWRRAMTRVYDGCYRRGLLAAPLAAEAQQTPMPEIGFLSSTSSAPYAPFVAAFLEGLKEVGFVEGRNVTIAYRWGDGQFDSRSPSRCWRGRMR